MVKKIILLLVCIIIIVFSFIMPNLFFQLEDLSREKEVFSGPKKVTKKIDVQAEKIYLVRFLHDIYELRNKKVYNTVSEKIAVNVPIIEGSEIEKPTEEIKGEIQKLVSSDIINEIHFEEMIDYYQTSKIFNSDYTVITCDMVSESEGISVGIEEKTGKIISSDFPKSFLRTDISKRKQLENYAKYLDLDIIDDWVYEDQILKSEKAQLFIILEERYDVCMLAISPMENYEEYEASRYEYEIVESEKDNKKK